MKKQQIKPTRSNFTILRQICNFIPQHTVSKIARETGAEDKSRTFTPWSHVVSQCYAQLTHSIGLNDTCDSLQLHSGPLASIRGAKPPSRNGGAAAANKSFFPAPLCPSSSVPLVPPWFILFEITPV